MTVQYIFSSSGIHVPKSSVSLDHPEIIVPLRSPWIPVPAGKSNGVRWKIACLSWCKSIWKFSFEKQFLHWERIKRIKCFLCQK